jgi:hypothetical protein
MKDEEKKSEFMRSIGIDPALAARVTELIERPDIFFSMTLEERSEMERRMTAVLFSIGQVSGRRVETLNRASRNL